MSPQGFLSQLSAVQFFSARNSPLVSSLLPISLLFTVRALGIASRSPTKRCRRSGKSVKRGLTVKKFLQCALINARSIQCNMYIIQQHIVCHNLDVVAITESWLREDSGDDILRELCPAGYSSLHKPRIGKRGRGVAIIFRDTVRARPLILDYVALSFELLRPLPSTPRASRFSLSIDHPPTNLVSLLMSLQVCLNSWFIHPVSFS